MRTQLYGVPIIIDDACPQLSDKELAEQMRLFRRGGETYAITISGDCLTGLDIHDGDTAMVDASRMPEPGDACVCLALWPGHKEPSLMGKQFLGTIGGLPMVGTRYGRRRRNPDGSLWLDAAFPAREIFGVICACYAPDGQSRWEKDVTGNPAALPVRDTIRGVDGILLSRRGERGELTYGVKPGGRGHKADAVHAAAGGAVRP